jgi:hypothetical protein
MPPKPPPFVNPLKIPRLHTSNASVPTAVTSSPITLKMRGPQESSPIDRVFKSPEALSMHLSSHKRAALKLLRLRKRIFFPVPIILCSIRRGHTVSTL